MTPDHRISDTVPPATADATFPAGKVDARHDAPALDLIRLRRLGLVADLVPLDLIEMRKLVRDRRRGADMDLRELTESIAALGLSNPIRLESRADGRFELVQGYRRLCAFRTLLDQTGDSDRFGTIPAVVSPAGEGLDALYRRMVDENLVRKDISFAEMARLALDYAADPVIGLNDPDRAVAILFRSAGYQKRSYIRSFIPVVERLGPHLNFAEDIPRALGMVLSRRLEQDETFAARVRAALATFDNRSVADEIGVLRRLAGQGDDDEPAMPPRPAAPARLRPSRDRTSFQVDGAGDPVCCVAGQGRLEIRLDRDFTAIDRRRLEQAVRALLDHLY